VTAAIDSPARAGLPQHDLPALEAFRGIAAVMIVVTHVGFVSGAGQAGPWAGWLSRLDFGVTLFFLLSGFLLFRPFVRAAYGRHPPVAVRSYLRRRVLRIYPAFLLVVVADYLIMPEARQARGSLWIQTIFLVQNYGTNFLHQIPGLVQTWSLVIEVSFYLCLPVVARVALGRGTTMASASARARAARSFEPVLTRRAARERRRRPLRQRVLGTSDVRSDLAGRRPGIVLALLIALAVVGRLYYLVHSHGLAPQLLWLPPFLDWFGVGMAMAWIRERDVPVPAALRLVANLPGACWSLALAGYWLATTPLGGPFGLAGPGTGQAMVKHVIYTVIAALLLLPPVFGDPGAGWRPLATNRFFSWLGQVSFGVFLWHTMLLAAIRRILLMPAVGGGFWITLILTLIASTIAGTLSWRCVEQPLQRRWRGGIRLRTGRAAPAPPVPDLATS
jgi:peptidoglycan/LPS O-acetylase OafA/YrhL